jgi:hypothetical protein
LASSCLIRVIYAIIPLRKIQIKPVSTAAPATSIYCEWQVAGNGCYLPFAHLLFAHFIKRLTEAALLQRGMKMGGTTPQAPRPAALFSRETDSAGGTATMNENLLLTADG